MSFKFSRLHQPKASKCATFFSIATLSLTLIGFTSGCASSQLEREKARSAARKQAALIEAVKFERAAPEVTKKIAADTTLSAAEAHLQAALEALKNSSDAIEKSLTK